MEAAEQNLIPKTAFVLFNNGAFGGAEKRFSNLFRFLYNNYPDKFYFFINNHLNKQISRIYPDFPNDNIRIVDLVQPDSRNKDSGSVPEFYKDTIPDPMEIDRKAGFARKIYWFQKNKIRQRRLFNIIEQYRKELNIQVFIGVFSGILPLVFYFRQNPRTASVIFSDMDSWFSEVHPDMKKLWYRKYYSFNYALENADYIDFLSPFIAEGVKKKNILINENKINITSCSFVDYSKCSVGKKTDFEIAFCSRLEPGKNPMLFLSSAVEILKDHPEIKFHLLGEGSLVNEIKTFISDNSLEGKINFQFHTNPPEIFSETSIFVSLQTGTNYPSQSLIEAMACGNAVIAGNTGDTGLLINKTNGLLVELNTQSVVSAMKTLINDRNLAAEMGLNGRNFVMKEHTIQKQSKYYIDLIIKAKNKIFGNIS